LRKPDSRLIITENNVDLRARSFELTQNNRLLCEYMTQMYFKMCTKQYEEIKHEV